MRIPLRFTITRQELYNLVWSKQFGPAAEELGITKASLDSFCCRNKVPRPSSLFWRHEAIGKPEEPKPLPNPEKNPEIELRPGLLYVRDPVLRKEAAQEMTRIASSKLFKVGEDLRGCHRLVSRARHLLLTSKWAEKGIVRAPEGCLAIGVSKGNIRRSLLLMDAILRGFEGLGYRVGFASGGWLGTVVEVMGLEVRFEIREYLSIIKLKNENADPLAGQYGIPNEGRCIDLIPAGRLRIEMSYYRPGRDGLNVCNLHEQVSETKTTPMEERLKEFALAVINTVARAKEAQAWADKREEEKWEAFKREQEEERRRESKWAEIALEQARVDALIEESEGWATSNKLRDYIKAKKADYVSRGINIGPRSDAGKWLKWASDQADRLDPLTVSPPSILDDEDEYTPKDDD